MELTEAVRRRRMVRRFDPARPVDLATVRRLVDLATRAPSAGNAGGRDFVALLDEADRAAFWSAATPGHHAPRPPAVPPDGHDTGGTTPPPGPDAWLAGVRAAPALLVCLSDPTAYLDRYAEPDKGWTDRSLDRWPIPYWDIDTAMAAMLVLLGAVDAGLGALFFGVPAERHQAVRAALEVPADRRLVGVVALGHEAARVRSPSLRRGRRGVEQVLSLGRFGASAAAPSDTSARMGATPDPGTPGPRTPTEQHP
ncbi:MAG TPA: nitroreductase family protein [Dermatophilaceae bacterium]|nr:nitroreductase family protein [Dermatophilaceae bacterium]